MRRFWLIVLGLTALAEASFALAVSALARSLGAPLPPLWGAALALLALALLPGRLSRQRADARLSGARVLLVEEPYFVHWCAALLALPLSAVALVVCGALALASAAPFLEAASLALLGVHAFSLALAFWGVVVRRRWVRLRRLDVAVEGLPAAFDGYEIAHLSDLHIGSFCPKRRALSWAERVNALGVDLVVFTGDYVTSGTTFHEDIAEAIASFSAKDGTVAIMGNHDYFGGGEPMMTRLRERGVTLLRNERMTLSRGEARVTLAGVDDTWTRRTDIDRALSGRDESVPLLVLAHDPSLFPELARRGADLVLAGHTHWGQVALPFAAARVNLSRLTYRLHAGVYREGKATLSIHPGLGTTGPPVRLGAAPEIAIVRLRAA